ncbi:response regulator [Paenibacillus sp. LPE1-1-1.1]|uniref:response regulator n=1 Tax=Paenibacillus sp. LPE1-1-1.1 TaxID=3135230 RepID=UPI00343AF085
MFKLMIVDDELLMRIGIRSMIDWEAHGFRIAAEAANGKEAIEMAHSVKPDLIITDIKMPVMDGLQLIREASKTFTDCKYVILSNFDEFRYVKEALQLGAIDYLIKSEITPEVLAELLAGIRRKRELGGSGSQTVMLTAHISQSLSHLKESLFKDLISGLLGEKEAAAKVEQLQACVRSENLTVIKLRLDGFAKVRQKYVEKDEKLLRFSVLNILEEIIPGKWNKELVVESSSEYLLIANTRGDDMMSARSEIAELCGSIQRTMKDFMNMSITIGVSSVVSGFRLMKAAYREADYALRRSFFAGGGRIIFFEDTEDCPSDEIAELAPKEANEANALALSHVLDRNNEAKLTEFFDAFRGELAANRANERMIREAYIGMTEIVGAHMSYMVRSRLQVSDKLPYEAVLSAETWDDVHGIVLDYARLCLAAEGRSVEQRSYADMAVEMIHRYYAEDLSLQSVASQINVNPSYLSRLFKQEKGENFISCLTRVRIDRAKSFLESRKYKVYEVADKVGYHNYTYFSKIFKKVVGVSPEEYRG